MPTPRTPFDVTRPDPLAELVGPVIDRDPAAIEAFVRAAAPTVLRVVRQILGSEHSDVADVVQESLFSAIEALRGFDGKCTVRHFLWRVAALTAMNARRRLRLREQITPPDSSADKFASMALIGASALLLTLAAAAALYRGGFWDHVVWRGSLPSPLSAPKPLVVSADAVHTNKAPDPRAEEPKTTRDDDVNPPTASHSSETTDGSEVLPRSVSSPTALSIRGSDNTEPTTLAANTVKNAVELFSAANAARRGRKTQEAVALYLRLQAEYPSSDEALVSHVLLARLELGRGAAPVALREFDAYLERAPRGALTQEALQGRAQALSRLGRKQEETATWRRLLQEFPNSVYARSAREHLGDGTDAR